MTNDDGSRTARDVSGLFTVRQTLTRLLAVRTCDDRRSLTALRRREGRTPRDVGRAFSIR